MLNRHPAPPLVSAGLHLLRLVVAAAVISGFAASASRLGASSESGGPSLKVVATHLNNPRKLFVGPDGALYVAEAGTGGKVRCTSNGLHKICLPVTPVELTGSITRITSGAQTRVVSGLASKSNTYQQRAEGPAAVLVQDGIYYVLLQNVASMGANAVTPVGAPTGDLISTAPGKATPKVLANFAAFERDHNPDHGAGPGAKFANPPIDSDPYAFTAYRGGFAVADAGANDLLWVSPEGKVSVLAVFPTQIEKLTEALARRIGAPPTQRSITVQSVPSCVTVGPDGALYVGELTGYPFEPGTARIWRIVSGEKTSLYASGFTNITDLAFDGKNLLVLEMAAKGLAGPQSPGALIRLAPNGKRSVLAGAGLVAPTGLAVGNGLIYISNYGIYPGTGPGPHGGVVSIRASLGS
jgi:hypothetical protein